MRKNELYEKLIANKKKISRNGMKEGGLYLWEYKAKWYPEKLEFYDSTPCALVVNNKLPNHLYGMNLNFLPVWFKQHFNFQKFFERDAGRRNLFKIQSYEMAIKKFGKKKSELLIRQYIKTRIKNIYQIERDEFKYVFKYNYGNFENISTTKILKNFMDVKKLQRGK